MKKGARSGFRQTIMGDRRGVAAVEFALVLPLLLTIYLAGFEIEECLTIFRKICGTTNEIANITSQYNIMSSNDITNVFNASSQTMAPYSTTNISIVLTELSTTGNGIGTVVKSCANAYGTPLATGYNLALPAGMIGASTPTTTTYLILVQSTYTYQPTIGAPFLPNGVTWPISDQIFMLPRQSSSITFSSGCP